MPIFTEVSQDDIKARLRQFSNMCDLSSQEFYDLYREREDVTLPNIDAATLREWVGYCRLAYLIGLLH